MNALKSLALAGVAVAGLGMFATTDAEARGFRGGGGGFHRGGGLHLGGARHFGGRHLGGLHRRHIHSHRHGIWRHGRWIGGGFGIAVVGDSCYRYRWLDTPYGPVRRLVNVCAW